MTTSPERTPVIVAAYRTPIGKLKGQLAKLRPDDLAAHIIRALVNSVPQVVPHLEDVVFGAANQAGEDNRNVGRMAALLAGLPLEVPGVTVNRLCGSGMEAIIQASKSVMVGEGAAYIAGGVESMTRAPFVTPKAEEAFARTLTSYDTALGWRLINPRMQALYPIETLGDTAENVAEKYAISREAQDAFAFASHHKAAAAQKRGDFAGEIIAVPQTFDADAKSGQQPQLIETDECVRPDTSLEKLAKLAPVFRKGGSVTAGNSSPLNDGAAGLLITSQALAYQLGLKPLARIIAWGHAGVHPSFMGIGPVPAVRKALARAELTPDQLDVIEFNEAFAAQVLACAKELDIPSERLNALGGAIALGHPLGCSGARLVATLVHQLAHTGGRYGLGAMCIGVGQGIACVVERV